MSHLRTSHQSSASQLSNQKPWLSTNLQVRRQECFHSPEKEKPIVRRAAWAWSQAWWPTRRPVSPVRLDTGCNHTSDSCKDSQTGQSPRRSSSRDTSVAGGTGCTGHSHSCTLNRTARAWRPTAAAACSLNWREPKRLKLHRCAADTHKAGRGCDHSLVCGQTESQSFSTQSHSTLTLLQGPLLQPLVRELNKPAAPAHKSFRQSLIEDSWCLLMSRWGLSLHKTSPALDCTLGKQQLGLVGTKKNDTWTRLLLQSARCLWFFCTTVAWNLCTSAVSV